jgi:serine/threonine protein kinase
MIGQTIGHYQVLEQLGEGGMGVVYKARDTRLERLVAIKVLPTDRMSDPERKQRFIQEAKAASALNHPNIITIHDIASDDGTDYMVMEYVAGRTLGQMIPRKGLPLRETLRCAIQVADALASAHAAGIVHRDLKPGNIMVTAATTGPGLVKVLDFGLAKLTEPATPAEAADLAPTVTVKTEEGALLGTVAYMSPEQAEGKPLDARSDIFSFGALLYEMTTGRQAFRGDSKVSVLAAILREDPEPASQAGEDVPPELDRIIARCLKKEPARRFQYMADVKVALEELRDESESGKLLSRPRPPRPRRRWRLAATLAAAAGLFASGLGIGLWLRRPAPSAPELVLTRLTFDSGLTTDPAISPDGKLLAFASDRSGSGNLDIWVQQLAGGEPIRLTRDLEDYSEPSFAPDGSRIAFRSEREGGGVYVVSTLGGDARLIAKEGRGPRFSPGGNLIAYWVGNPGSSFFTRGAGKVYVVPSGGGSPREVAPQFETAYSPAWLPDGKRLLFGGVGPGERVPDLWVAALDGSAPVKTGALEVLGRRRLMPARLSVCFRPGEQLGFVFPARLGDSVDLWQLALSPRTWKVEGAAERLTFGADREVQPSAAAGGLLAFASLTEATNIWSLPLDANRGKVTGALERLTRGAAPDLVPSVSADGNKVVFLSNRSGNGQAWMKDLGTGKETALASSRRPLSSPIITADGSKVAYREAADRRWTTYAVPLGPDGRPGLVEKICEDCGPLQSWSPDGRRVLYTEGRSGSVGLLEVASGKKAQLLAHPEYSLSEAHFSPDGRWLAFLVRTSATHSRVSVAPFHEGKAVAPGEWIAVTGGEFNDDKPRWSPDGSLLYFTSERDGFRCIWAQSVDRATKRPTGEPFAVYHSHNAQRSLANLGSGPSEMSVARDRLVFNLGERTGAIWLARPPEQRSEGPQGPAGASGERK